MSEKQSALDYIRQTLSMGQQLAGKKGYGHLLNYIDELPKARKLAKLQVLINQGLIEEDDDIKYYRARLQEEAKAYFMSMRTTELTILGWMLGDPDPSGSGIKPSKRSTA